MGVFRPRCGCGGPFGCADDGRGGCACFRQPRPAPSRPPHGTPDEIVMALNGMNQRGSCSRTPIRARLEEAGLHRCPPPKTPAEVDALYAEQRETWIPLVRGTGVRAGAEVTFCPCAGSGDSAQGNSHCSEQHEFATS